MGKLGSVMVKDGNVRSVAAYGQVGNIYSVDNKRSESSLCCRYCGEGRTEG